MLTTTSTHPHPHTHTHTHTRAVKWNGKKFDNVPLYPDSPSTLFQATLFSLTGVPPERQKVLLKGGMVKGTEAHLNDRGVRPGMVVMVGGGAFI